MRPLRFLLLLGLFIVLPTVLTCVSVFSSKRTNPDTLNVGYTRAGRFRALFSFATPSSLFPPTAIITLTGDNTTSFLARPAAFGPGLPSHGLSAELWVGKGFGENIALSDEELKFSGLELGCSDVPGWSVDLKGRPESGGINEKSVKNNGGDTANRPESMSSTKPSKRDGPTADTRDALTSEDDGTDVYLHRPLPDSNPATSQKPGEPASAGKQDKGKQSTHADIESLQESADIAGKVVMLSRGGCGFLEKVKWAQRRGAITVIIGDNKPSDLITMYPGGDASNVTVPAIFTSFYSAKALSSLVPAEQKLETGSATKPASNKDGKINIKGKTNSLKVSGNPKLDSTKTEKIDAAKGLDGEKGWIHDVLSAVGLNDDVNVPGEDSRRPPGSGNIDWVLLKDWDDDKPTTTSANTQRIAAPSSKTTKVAGTSSKNLGNDDFIIGVHDWRDTELIAPKTSTTQGSKNQKGKAETTASQPTTLSSSIYPTATVLKGGIITPGSGEYDHQKEDASNKGSSSNRGGAGLSDKHSDENEDTSFGDKLASLFHLGSHEDDTNVQIDEHPNYGGRVGTADTDHDSMQKEIDRHGLWVTVQPASPSASPFFDTLLVLVVSPLVTLTFVYGLLLLRSRIRRRRWRAPKSIVERLPVRTYHTMSATPSAASTLLSSPQPSSTSSPAYGIANQQRARPRSQTTASILSPSTSTPTEKTPIKPSSRYKRYTGRQVECVVCLEEYVDGESQVMSLPCGHEFHVECITPWLVTRRRTCPICKGDVVRTLARANYDFSSLEDAPEENVQTSDDVQEQAVMTENSAGSAAIPIPISEDTAAASDIERGGDVETPLLGATPRVQQGRWRGILSGSWSHLSGDTVWRSSVNDRTR